MQYPSEASLKTRRGAPGDYATMVAAMNDQRNEHVGRLILRLREKLGMTQADLAKAADVGRPWLSRVEIGSTKNPGREKLERLARVLRVTPEVLLAPAGHRVTPLPPPPQRRPEELIREALVTLEQDREEQYRHRLIESLLTGKTVEQQLALIPEELRNDVSASFLRVPTQDATYVRMARGFVRDWLTEQSTETLERLSREE